MRVLRLTPFFHHPDVEAWPSRFDPVGGMQIQTWRQAAWLAENGVAQHVLTIGFPGLARVRDLQPNLRVERASLPMPEIRSELTGLIGLTQAWGVATLIAVCRLARQRRFDLVHAHFDGQIPALLVALAAPAIIRRPLVVTVHCSRLAVYKPYSLIDTLQDRLARWLEKRVLRRAAVTMVLTERTRAILEPFARRIVVTPDVVDAAEFVRPAPEAVARFRERHGLRRRTIGYVGRIAAEKGWPHLIQLARALRDDDVDLLIVGDGPQRARLDQEIAAHGLRDRVVVTGFIPNSAVPVALAACEAIVMPSSFEEFGGASIEAFAVGIPVVAFAVGGLQEIVGQVTPGLLVPPGDTAALIARVRAVLAGAHRDETDAAVLRRSVVDRYSGAAVGARVLALYREQVSLAPNPKRSEVTARKGAGFT